MTRLRPGQRLVVVRLAAERHLEADGRAARLARLERRGGDRGRGGGPSAPARRRDRTAAASRPAASGASRRRARAAARRAAGRGAPRGPAAPGRTGRRGRGGASPASGDRARRPDPARRRPAARSRGRARGSAGTGSRPASPASSPTRRGPAPWDRGRGPAAGTQPSYSVKAAPSRAASAAAPCASAGKALRTTVRAPVRAPRRLASHQPASLSAGSARRGHRRHGLAEGSAQVLVRERPAGLAEAERLEDEPGREGLAALAEIAAGIAEAHGAAQHRQAAHDVMERLGHPVGGPDQERVEALALGVEEHGVLEQRREDAPLLQPQDERVRAAGVAGAGERRDVETPGPRAVAADREAGQAVSHEAQDLGARTQRGPRGRRARPGRPRSRATAAPSSGPPTAANRVRKVRAPARSARVEIASPCRAPGRGSGDSSRTAASRSTWPARSRRAARAASSTSGSAARSRSSVASAPSVAP